MKVSRPEGRNWCVKVFPDTKTTFCIKMLASYFAINRDGWKGIDFCFFPPPHLPPLQPTPECEAVWCWLFLWLFSSPVFLSFYLPAIFYDTFNVQVLFNAIFSLQVIRILFSNSFSVMHLLVSLFLCDWPEDCDIFWRWASSALLAMLMTKASLD